MAAIAMAALAVLAGPLRSACHGSTYDLLTMALLTMALLTLSLTPTLTSCWPRRCALHHGSTHHGATNPEPHPNPHQLLAETLRATKEPASSTRLPYRGMMEQVVKQARHHIARTVTPPWLTHSPCPNPNLTSTPPHPHLTLTRPSHSNTRRPSAPPSWRRLPA